MNSEEEGGGDGEAGQRDQEGGDHGDPAGRRGADESEGAGSGGGEGRRRRRFDREESWGRRFADLLPPIAQPQAR